MTREESTAVRLNWRLYRLSLLPLAIALLLAAFSFGTPPAPLRSSLTPETFDGQAAVSLVRRMQALAPHRQLGSSGDARLLAFIRRFLRELGGPETGGYALSTDRRPVSSALGARVSASLIATRPGSSSQLPIVLLAHRDGSSSSPAQLSGTAALLELAAVLSRTETRHPIDLVFADGASAGAPTAAALLAAESQGGYDAAIALGDLAGTEMRRPLSQPFSSALGNAPQQLQSTVSAALSAQLHTGAGAPSIGSQLAHFIFPLSTGEEGPLNAAGIPAVSVQLAGEAGPSRNEPVSALRLQRAGSAVLGAVYALDRVGAIESAPDASLQIAGRTVPPWAVMLVIFTTILGPLLVCLDALVRVARRGRRVAGWSLLVLACALPFLACAIVLIVLGAAGLIPAPAEPAPAPSITFGAGAGAAIVLAAAAFFAAWRVPVSGRVLPLNLRDLLYAGFPRAAPAGLISLAAACLLALVVWVINPYAALLLVAALHLWLPLVSPQQRPSRRSFRLLLALAPALPLCLVILHYALALRLGAPQTLLSGAMMIAGGYIGFGAALLWSLGLGLLAATMLAALPAQREAPRPSAPGGGQGSSPQRGEGALEDSLALQRASIRVGVLQPARSGAGVGRKATRRHARL